MKWTIILIVVNAFNPQPVEYHKVIEAASKEECIAIGAADAKRFVAAHPELMIGVGCKEGVVDEPAPEPPDGRDI